MQSGGSFGKPANVVEGKRAARKLELSALVAALRAGESGPDEVFVCGDFNCDSNFLPDCDDSWSHGCAGWRAGWGPTEKSAKELWPEVELLPERALPGVFADAWEEHQEQCKLQGDDTSSGCTESPSNLMRAALKPGQGRDARFDKVVVMRERVRVQSAELVGAEQCAEVEKDDGEMLPLFPSDHFGVLVVAEDLARP